MKKNYFYFSSGQLRQWLIALMMLFAVGAQAIVEEKSKTYDFRTLQSLNTDPQQKSTVIILSNQAIWDIQYGNEDTVVPLPYYEGLFFKGVTEHNISLHCNDTFTKIHSIVVKAGAATNASAEHEVQTVYLNAGSGSAQFMEITPSQVYLDYFVNIQLQDYVFEVSASSSKSFSIDFSTYYGECADVLIQEVTVYYSDEEEEDIQIYDLWVDGNEVTSENMGDVKGDGTVSFDGHNRLTLKGGIMQEIVSALPELEINLVGSTLMSNQSCAVEYVGQDKRGLLTFMTNCNEPGSFYYQNYAGALDYTVSDAFSGYEVSYRDNLSGSVSKVGQNEVNMVSILVPLQPIVDDNSSTPIGTETHIDYSTDAGEVETADLSNFTYRNVLYTLHDTQKPNAADDGFANGQVVLNSTMTDNEVAALNGQVADLAVVPGTIEYAEAYKGLTFVVPAGTGVIKVNAETTEGYEFHLKIGGQEPVTVVDKSANGGASYEIPYAVSKATYVYLYLTASTASATQKKGPRIGPKSTVSGGLGGLDVSGNNIANPGDGSTTYLLCTRDMLYREASGGITVTNADVTDIDADTFAGIAGAPRRAFSENIPFIDLTNTAIVGKDVSRYSGAFEGFPEQTLIYMPAGNTSSEPNVIIAGVCEDMRLVSIYDGTSFVMPSTSNTFTASKASYVNSFQSETPSIFCLPYDLETAEAAGTFFEYEGFDESTATVKMKVVDALSLDANKAYVFTPTSGVTTLPDMTNVSIVKAIKDSDPSSTTEADGLHGVYKSYNWFGTPSGVYVLDGAASMFTQSGGALAPFGGYLRLASAPAQLSIKWGNQTSIISLSADQVRQDADGWYTITGVRLPAKPTDQGLYIHNGKKVMQ